MSENIVYTTVGGQKGHEYGKMALYLIKSINYNIIKNPVFFTFIIITDIYQYKFMKTKIRELKSKQKTNFKIKVKRSKLRDPFMLKLDLFNVLDKKEKHNCLYIDADILCGEQFSFLNFIEKCLYCDLANKYLYAMKESINNYDLKTMHNLIYFRVDPYDDSQLNFFEKNQISPFNSGLYCFKLSFENKIAFTKIQKWMIEDMNTGKRAFTEQAYMNSYFCTRNLVKYDKITSEDCTLFVRPDQTNIGLDKLLHFCGDIGKDKQKREFMFKFIKKNFSTKVRRAVLN